MIETMRSRTMMDRLAAKMKADGVGDHGSAPNLTISARSGSSMIDITVEHTNPEVASRYANGLVDEYQMFRMETVAKATRSANQFLLDEAKRLRDKLTASELSLQEYREKKNAISLEKDQDVVVSRFREISNQLNQAKDQRSRIEADRAIASKLGQNPAELAKLSSVVAMPIVVSAQQQHRQAENNIAFLSQRYLSKHPKFQAAQAEVEIAKKRLDESLISAAASLKDAFESAKANESRLQEEFRSQEVRTYDLGRLQVDYDKLKREIDADQVVYEQVLGRLKETDLTKGLEEIQNVPLKVIEPATASYAPVRPDKKKTMWTGILGGAGLGLCIAIGLYMIDNSVRTVIDVETLLDLPVLSAISTRKKLSAEWQTMPHLDTVHHQHGPISESFRTLRSAMILLGRDTDRKVILVTSAVPGEGKSFTACNFAVTLAQAGLSTVLVDLDLRRPTVAKVFFDVAPKVGATDVLAGQAALGTAVQSTSVPNLSVLATGSRAPNPSELLSTEALPTLISRLAKEYDRVVIDSPPVIAVSDPLLISPYVDTILQVVRSLSTPKNVVQRACAALAKSSSNGVSGIVLNQLPTRSRGYYYYYYSGYYGEKGVYGAPA
jgi:Mrp family chromosome partitioning ATPase